MQRGQDNRRQEEKGEENRKTKEKGWLSYKRRR